MKPYENIFSPAEGLGMRLAIESGIYQGGHMDRRDFVVTTEFIRCPDPTSNLVAKITRTKIG